MALEQPWLNRTWSSPEVIDAYVNFAIDMIDRFNPTHFEYGTEISELIINDIDSYSAYQVFAQAVYTRLKTAYPNLKLVTSIAFKAPNSSAMQLIADNIGPVLNYTDVLGISTYPYVFFDHADRGDPQNLPATWLTQVTSIANDIPVLISETGWVGENLSIPEFSYSETSDENKQAQYVTALLEAANALDAEVVIWWTISDYDTLWVDTLGEDPLAKIWKDIGLYNESQQPRSALAIWDEWLERDFSPSR